MCFSIHTVCLATTIKPNVTKCTKSDNNIEKKKMMLVSHLEVTLVSVENDGLLPVEYPLHFQGQPTNSWLEIGLLGVHH